MKRMWLLTALCLIPLIGCYRQTYISMPQPPDPEIAASTGTETDSSYAAGGTAAATAGAVEAAVPTQPAGTAPPETQPSATAGPAETGREPSSAPTAGDPNRDVPETSVPRATETGSGDSDGSGGEESKPTEPPVTSPPATAPSLPPVTAPPPVTETPSAPPAGGNSISAEFVLALINQARANAGLPPLDSDGTLAGLGRSWDGSGTLLEYLLASGYDCPAAGTESYAVIDDAYAAEMLEEWVLSNGGSFLSADYTRAGIDLQHNETYILIALYYAG